MSKLIRFAAGAVLLAAATIPQAGAGTCAPENYCTPYSLNGVCCSNGKAQVQRTCYTTTCHQWNETLCGNMPCQP